MARPRPIETVELLLSYRQHDCAGPCCYVLATAVRSDGQSTIIDSRHLAGAPEQVVDDALELARQWTLEHYLPLTSPF